jgi:AbrB family looped-hinge helix DNA binding protein
MEELIEIKTAKITEKGQIAIPKEIRKKGFKEGEKVAILAYSDHMEIRPINQIKNWDLKKEGIQTALLSEKILAKEWLTKEEDQTWKNL